MLADRVELSERRRAQRMQLGGGSAVCREGGDRDVYDVIDVSRLGIALKEGIPHRENSTMELDVWWPGLGAGTAIAKVVRVAQGGHGMGLEFLDTDRGMDALVRDIRDIHVLRATSPATLIYTTDAALAAVVGDSMTARGKRLLFASSSLNAVCAIGDPWNAITSVVVDAGPQGLEFASFLRDTAPQISRMIAYGSSATARRGLRSGLADELFVAPRASMFEYTECLSCGAPVLPRHVDAVFCAECTDRTTNLSEDYDDLGVGD